MTTNPKPPKPIRDAKHLENIRQCCCIICGKQANAAHHLLRTSEKAMGRRSGDNWTVPMCSFDHAALHACGDEKSYFSAFGLDGQDIAEKLFMHSIYLEIMQRFAQRMAEVARRAGR